MEFNDKALGARNGLGNEKALSKQVRRRQRADKRDS
jgi:hypothetical protein